MSSLILEYYLRIKAYTEGNFQKRRKIFLLVNDKKSCGYSLVRLVVPNTEELISWPLLGLFKIHFLFQDDMRSPEFRN